MHSPMYMVETEVKDRVSSYHWQAAQRRLENRTQDDKARSWLHTMQSGVRSSLSRPAAAVRSWIAQPPAPQEQCC